MDQPIRKEGLRAFGLLDPHYSAVRTGHVRGAGGGTRARHVGLRVGALKTIGVLRPLRGWCFHSARRRGITVPPIPKKWGKAQLCNVEEYPNPATKEVAMPFLQQWRLPRFLHVEVCDAHARWQT